MYKLYKNELINLVFLISFGFLLYTITVLIKFSWIVPAFLLILSCILIKVKKVNIYINPLNKHTWKSYLFSFCFLLLYFFLLDYANTGLSFSILIISCITSIFSLLFFFQQIDQPIKLRKLTYNKIVVYGFLLILSAIFIALCSRSSFLYTINDSADPNIFFTVGKSIFKGKVLYKDIYEQNGPYLFLLHGLASLISQTSFLGVYYLEVFINWIFLIYIRKIIYLYIRNDLITFIGIPIAFAIIVASKSFWFGDNAEEICWPFLIYGLYVLLKSLKNDSLISNKEYFYIGITSGFVLWVKYTMLGFYIGWYLVPLVFMIYRKEFKSLLFSIVWIITGVFTVSLPILLYFLLNNALPYLWETYFYNNIFLYSIKNELPLLTSLLNALKDNIVQNIWLSFLILLSFVWMIFQTKAKEFIGYFLCFIGLFLSTYIGGRYYPYYFSCLAIFVTPGIILLYYIINRVTVPFRQILLVPLSLGFSLWIIYSMSSNVPFINKPEDEYPQYTFSKIMNQISDPTLLNYGTLDSGFNTYANIIPNNRFYSSFNVPLSEIGEEQNNMVNDGEFDFIITGDPNLHFNHYSLIATKTHNRGEGDVNYSLYARNDLKIEGDY